MGGLRRKPFTLKQKREGGEGGRWSHKTSHLSEGKGYNLTSAYFKEKESYITLHISILLGRRKGRNSLPGH